MATERRTTIFSVLALVTLVTGGGATYLGAAVPVRDWVASGSKFPVDRETGEAAGTVTLATGEQPVYFESPEVLPQGAFLQLYLADAAGRPVDRRALAGDEADRNRFEKNGVVGRTVFRVDVPAAGEYSYRFINANAERFEGDVIVFGKEPDTLAECLASNRRVKIVGASITGVLVVGLYVAHGLALGRAGRRPEHPTPQRLGTDPGTDLGTEMMR